WAAAGDPRDQREPERTGAGYRGCAAGGADGAAARAARGWLWRVVDGRHAGDHRRYDAGVAGERGVGRVQRDVPVPARGVGRFCRARGAGIAAARDFPPGVRGTDVAGESWVAVGGEPVFPNARYDAVRV